MYWWVELEYPDAFDWGKDKFFPRPGQVVKYYRERKMDDKGKAWTQKGLAKTLGVTDNAVRDIENRDVGMDDFGRRQFLCKLFDIPPMLLGIMTPGEIELLLEKHRNAKASVAAVSIPGVPSRKLTIDLNEYSDRLSSLWSAHRSTAMAHTSKRTALTSIDALYRELPHAPHDQLPIQNLLCGYNRFISDLLCEACDYDATIEYLDRAFTFAELVGDEQTALILKGQGNALWKTNRLNEALCKFDAAWGLEKKLPRNFRGSILLESGRARAQHAHMKQDKQAKIEVVRSVDLVGNIIRASYNEEDPYLFKLDLDCYHLYKSSVLITIGWNKEAAEELKLIKGFPHYRLRQVYYDILQAQVYTNRGKYEQAAGLLEVALEVAQEVNSEINIGRVESIFKQLQQSPYKDSPDVARIDYLLYKKPRVQKP